jgi:hypothetical protein
MKLIKFTYGKGFAPVISMRQKVERIQEKLATLTPYEPVTRHYFHAGMYCREVWRKADVLVVGKVHKKEHFYLIVSGTVLITDGIGEPQRFTGPHMIQSAPGTKRAVYAETDVLCMTFHRTDATTVEAAEAELVEDDPTAMYTHGNRIKQQDCEVLQ